MNAGRNIVTVVCVCVCVVPHAAGVSSDITRGDLIKHFERFGVDRDSVEINREKSYAFVTLLDKSNETAKIAAQELNMTSVSGHPIGVARARRAGATGAAAGAGRSGY